MVDAAECMFLYLESSLRVGSEEEGIDIDLPIQREAATGYPLLPASSLKGVLRSRARLQQAPIELLGLLGSPPESEEPQPKPSSVVVSDAIPLVFPVRSLTGLFAWVTSVETLSRFRRDVAAYGVKIDRTVTHGIACSVYFYDPENNRIELYYTTPFKVRQPLGEPIDLDTPDADLLAFARSFEEKKGPPRGAQQPLG